MAEPGNTKKHRCLVCSKLLSTKQRLITHTETQHSNIPNATDSLKITKYKQYIGNPSIPVPRTTVCRHKSKLKICETETKVHVCTDDTGDFEETYENDDKNFDEIYENEYSVEAPLQDEHSIISVSRQTVEGIQMENVSPLPDSEMDDIQSQIDLQDLSDGGVSQRQIDSDNLLHLDDANEKSDKEQDSQNCSYVPDVDTCNDGSDRELDTEVTENSDVQQVFKYDSMNDENYLSSDDSNSFSDYESSSSNDSDGDHEENVQQIPSVQKKNFSGSYSMAVLSLITKYHLNGECASDMLHLMSLLKSSDEEFNIGTLNTLRQTVGSCDAKLIDYCSKCYTLYPEDENIHICPKEGCGSLRFKGNYNQQGLKQRKAFFASLPLESQIKDILERDGVIDSMLKYRNEVPEAAAGPITDIISGTVIQELRKPGNFLSNCHNISLLFNTDGVPLYKSSKVSIWPIYLVINELPPSVRYALKNVLLWGIWQGQGKPVFNTFFQPFIQDLKRLGTTGLSININNQSLNVRALLICGTLDLQAKAFVTNMTMHNGEFGCITCEEAGQVVPQGKGHCRVYPFSENPAAKRTSEGFRLCAAEADRTNTRLGNGQFVHRRCSIVSEVDGFRCRS